MLFRRFHIFAYLFLRYEQYVGENEYVGIVTKPKRAQMYKSILYYKHTYLFTPGAEPFLRRKLVLS
jgi:hypothetical protein